MEIKSQFDHRGKTYKFTYNDGVPTETDEVRVDGVHSYCFYGDKLVIVGHGKDNSWTPPGGAIEKGENYTEAAIREIKEESNMKVLVSNVLDTKMLKLQARVGHKDNSECSVS